MQISANGLKKLMDWEGVVLHKYQDAAGLWTIGCGHLITKDENFTILTTVEAQDLLHKDLTRFENIINAAVKVPLNQNQFDALVIFTFNIGTGAFIQSTLLKKLNAGDYKSVPDQLMRWTKAGGKEYLGLVTRRKNEIALWNADE